jgi:hypothetical protein
MAVTATFLGMTATSSAAWRPPARPRKGHRSVPKRMEPCYPPSMPSTTAPVILRQEHTGHDHRHLEAYLDDQGRFHVDGHDLGPGTSPVSEDGEYEWFQTIDAGEVPRLVKLLGGAEAEPVLALLARSYTGERSYELERILRESGIPIHRHTWSG